MSTSPLDQHAATAAARYVAQPYGTFLDQLLALTVDVVAAAANAADVPENHRFVVGRRKAAASFAAKASKPHPRDPRRPKYLHPCDDITDQVAVRVMTLLPAQAEAVSEAFEDLDGVRVNESEPRPVELGKFGYMSLHLLLDLRRHPKAPRPPHDYDTPLVEVQCRTMLQHVWAELEHDVRYKGNPDTQVSRRFDHVAALVDLSDRLLQEAVDTTSSGQPPTPAVAPPVHSEDDSPVKVLDADAVRRVLDEVFADARPSRLDAYEWILPHVQALGLRSDGDLRDALTSLDLQRIGEVFADLGYANRARVKRLDDALLAYGLERYVDAVANDLPEPSRGSRRQRVGNLRWRLEQLRAHGVLAR